MNSDDLIVKKQWFIREKPGSIQQYYDLNTKNQLGQGAFGSCFLVKLKNSNITRAVKTIPKNKITDPKTFQNEINIMRTLDHPNVIKLYEIFDDSQFVYLVMEYCEGGELFDKIIEAGYFNEQKAKQIFREIVSGISHCHSSGICHRDLKPENFLLLNKSENSPIKIIDFGLSV